MNEENGYFFIYTGDGKGKTTAAIGLAVRALGWGKKVAMLQFIKSPDRTYGEKNIFEKLGIELVQTGIGFTWLKTADKHREALQKGWQLAKEKISSGTYDLIILDELANALAIEGFPIDDIISLDEVMAVIKNRPKATTIVVTGRNAKKELVEIADLVTEMTPVKHYYNQGVAAVKGIEF